MKYRWTIASSDLHQVQSLSRALGKSSLICQCLLNRGFSSPDACAEFLQPRLKQLRDPFLLPNMACAVDLLLRCRSEGTQVTLFGDYDVDGLTASALLMELLGRLGWKVAAYLPDRFTEGYGLTLGAVKSCVAEHNPGLILAVDCGSTSIESISYLAGRGIQTIVLDHHQCSDPLPAAVARVNPQLAAPDSSRFLELCSAGLAFKLAHALLKKGRELGIMGFEAVDLKSYLDLVCLGTVADMVPLTGENRIFASAGLKALGATTRPGLIALMTVAGIKEINDPQQIGFQLGPRLNAAGRLESAKAALRLLLTTDAHEAADLANDLNRTNEERQQLERAIFQEAKTWLRDNFVPERDWVIVAGNNSWHIGVVGIVASRIQHEFHRPAVVFGGDGSSWRGSARSIAGFDIAQAFHQCADLLSRHGGHSMAAGLSMAPENFSRFWERINSVAHQQLTLDHLTPELLIDAEVELGEITLERLIELGELQPFGIGNRPVHLAVRGVWHQQPPQRFGKEEKHVRFRVTDGKSVREAIWWNAAEAPLPKVAYDLAFVPELNHYNGLTTLRLRVLDWAPVTSLKATES